MPKGPNSFGKETRMRLLTLTGEVTAAKDF
jgi:hypothetical protein